MAEITDLNVTDASNTARFPENQNPSTVNNGARALEGLIARGFGDTIIPSKTTAGTADAQTVTPNQVVADITTCKSMFWMKAGATLTNTGAMTLNIADTAATGPLSVKTTDGLNPPAGAVTAGGYYGFICNGTQFILLNPSVATTADGTVTLAKLANLAQNKLIGRATASTGAPEAVGLGSGLSMVGGNLTIDSSGRLLARQIFTSSGTYTPTSGMAYCDVTIIGGGGAGGAVNSTARGAGGSGAGVKVRFSAATIGASKTVTIGAGGTGVVPNNVGTSGGASSLGTLVIAGGGAGGTISSLGGTGGTVSTGGDINVKGRAGSGQNAGIINDTRGGDSPFGLGTGGEGLSGANGVAGSGYGAGGSAASTGTSGAGAAGICIIEEYS